MKPLGEWPSSGELFHSRPTAKSAGKDRQIRERPLFTTKPRSVPIDKVLEMPNAVLANPAWSQAPSTISYPPTWDGFVACRRVEIQGQS